MKFSKYFSELCSEIHVYEVKIREITPTVRSEKVLSVTAPRRVHTAYHSGKKLRNTLEKVAPRSLSSVFAVSISPLSEYLALDLIQRKESEGSEKQNV